MNLSHTGGPFGHAQANALVMQGQTEREENEFCVPFGVSRARLASANSDGELNGIAQETEQI